MVDVSFSDISEKLRNRLLQLRAEGSFLKGVADEKADARAYFARKRPKSVRQWNNIRYFLMQRIDKARKNIGLSPIHFK